jgi:hypothetical protein
MVNSSGQVHLHIPDSVKQTASEDGAVLLDVERGICFSLNTVALDIWQLLKLGRNETEMLEIMLAKYPVSREQLHADIQAFLGNLHASGLLIADGAAEQKSGFRRRLWSRWRSVWNDVAKR